MSNAARRFGQQLTEAIYRIRGREDKSIGIVQDELGYAIGRDGGSAIEYWRKGNVPAKPAEVAALARILVIRAGVDRAWLANFLQLAGYSLWEQLCDELFPAAAPVAADTAVPHNLPTHPTSFIGRTQETQQVFDQLIDPNCRLLTLTGPGGVGKTRLAIEVASQFLIQHHFPDGVYFVALDPLETADAISPAITSSLNLTFFRQQDPKAQLLHQLQAQKLLLILDHFDHLVDGAGLLTELIEQAKELTLIVTSRERLNLRSEWIFPLAGLALPEHRQGGEETAVSLFIHAARHVQPNFDPDADELEAIHQICQAVEGFPLAIELAAAWTRLLSCADIVQEIKNNLDFLVTSQQDMPERHRSLRAVCDASWQRLSPEEQRAFCQLSVFRGGFDRQAAAQVAAATLPILSRLVDKSLLRVADNGRYDIHQILRQFAAEKLAQSPAMQTAVIERHSKYYASLLHKHIPDLNGRNLDVALQIVTTDLDNIKASWRWATENGRADLVARAMDALILFHEMRSRFFEGEALFRLAATNLASSQPDSLIWAQVVARQAWFRFRLAHYDESRALSQQSLAVLKRLEAAYDIPLALNVLAATTYVQGDYATARQYAQESLEIAESIDDPFYKGMTRINLGNIAKTKGDYAQAKQLYQSALAILEEADNQYAIGVLLNNLGDVAYNLGNYGDAEELYRLSMTIMGRIGHPMGISMTMTDIGLALLAQGNTEKAKENFIAGLRTAWKIQAYPAALKSLMGLAAWLVAQDNNNEEEALPILELVYAHPATEQKDRLQAESRLQALGREPEEILLPRPYHLNETLTAITHMFI